jgi:hypothetical protein
MADVSTYKRATVSYISGTTSVQYGEIRAATDPVVLAHPAYWVAFTDADFTGGRTKLR